MFGIASLGTVLRDDPVFGGARFVDACGMALGRDAWLGLLAGGPVERVSYDSRDVRPGDLFVCKGAAFSARYLYQAVAGGAVAYVAAEPHAEAGVPGVIVDSPNFALAALACAAYGHASEHMDVLAITGTKGKTSTAFMLDSILRQRGDGRRSALVSGVYIDDGVSRHPSTLTTPESLELQRYLRTAVDAGCDTAVLEASSQAFMMGRTYGTRLKVGAFTNIGNDHVSPIEHPTFEAYLAEKLKIFRQAEYGVVNRQTDRYEDVMAAASSCCGRVLTYGLGPDADVHPRSCVCTGRGRWDIDLTTPAGDLRLDFGGMGSFSVSNALAAVSCALLAGVDSDAIARGLEDVHVPGRLERYECEDGALVGIVDYAHNEMSLRAVLSCIRETYPGYQVTVVFGSTGTRAQSRRRPLGRAAGDLADRIILTEDEPDTVPVADICAEIGEGVLETGASYEVVEDRVEAIRRAVEGARRPAVVLMAGKGIERTMLRNGVEDPYGPDAKVFCGLAGIPYADSE